MGKYSSDSDDNYRSKKKKKRKSRSMSPHESEESYSSRKHSKKSKKSSKKSKTSRRSRSRSGSPNGHARRDRQRSRSRGRGKRSKSRSRSRDRYRKQRSRSRSRSVGRRHRSRSRSRSYSRRRSRSRSRHRVKRSRSHSGSRSRRGRSKSKEKATERTKVKIEKEDLNETVPGFDDMGHGKQAEVRMHLALKAAVAADEKLKEQGVLPVGVGRTREDVEMSIKEQLDRTRNLNDIESEDFVQAVFSSSRGNKGAAVEVKKETNLHDDAIFGHVDLDSIKSVPFSRQFVYTDVGMLLHPSLNVDPEEKMERWRQKLMDMRRKKLEGEAM